MLVRIYVTYIVQLVLIPDHSVIGDVILSVSQARDTIVLSSFFTYGCQTNNIPLNSTTISDLHGKAFSVDRIDNASFVSSGLLQTELIHSIVNDVNKPISLGIEPVWSLLFTSKMVKFLRN